nr:MULTISPECIES: I78 family peptidase inhibitor [unclassified Pantoea]
MLLSKTGCLLIQEEKLVTHYGKALLVTALFALSACQSASKPDTSAAASHDPETDQCGASQYQNYVGQPLSTLDSKRFAVPVRAIPWNSAVTMDFNLRRVNFAADQSGKISRVYCG